MTRKHTLLTLLLTTLLLTIACTAVDYRSPRFDSQTRRHQSVAVLPFEMVFIGKAPANVTVSQIARIEEAESLAFQRSFYYRLLNRAGKGKIAIEIQPIEKTNALLDDAGINVRESWHLPPEELARILKVDAVVRTRVEKTRYLSDLESFGVDLGTHVLAHATDGIFPWVVPATHDIWTDSMLLAGRDGALLWQVALRRQTDWTRPANDVIAGVTKKLAKKFPYRDG